MNTDVIFMLDNIRGVKEVLDKDIDQICKGMTESERKAYCMGEENLYNLFSAVIESNFEDGCFTIFTPKRDIEPSECTFEDLCNYIKRNMMRNE